MTNLSDLNRNQREELKALSREVFGAANRWQKLVEHGYQEPLTETATEYVPGEKEGDEGTVRQIQVPVKHEGKVPMQVTKRYTVDSIREYMLERKKMLEMVREQMKKNQEEAKAKEALLSKVNEELQGSAV
jgi:hypothetical protein